jgi:uncharacterized protein YdhG (YjbR/CyaY superfamily)
MPAKRPATIAEYIRAAPREGQPHLRRLHAILAKAAPKAEQLIKWGTPFFVEPRFLFSYSACKAHLNFAPSAKAMAHFRKDLGKHRTTKYFLQVRYDEELPEALIRRMAGFCVKEVRKRKDDAFW